MANSENPPTPNRNEKSKDRRPEEDDEELFEKIPDEKVPKTLTQFLRPLDIEAKHTVLSSPFAQRLMEDAVGHTKPKWYRTPTFDEFSDFKKLISIIEDGRKFHIDTWKLFEALKKFIPSLTMTEFLHVVFKIRENTIGEVDFGEFIVLLACNLFYDQLLQLPEQHEYFAARGYTGRQRILFSNLAFYCLVQTEYDIERFYKMSTLQHFDVLGYHLRATKTIGLNELEMEIKQYQARRFVEKFSKINRSPYTAPTPFVPASVNQPHYKNYLRRKYTLSTKLYPHLENPRKKKTTPKREPTKPNPPKLGRRQLPTESEDEQLIRDFYYAKLKRPDMILPSRTLKDMRTRVFENQREYITNLQNKALKEYYDRLKKAAVLFSKKTLNSQLKKGFPNDSIAEEFRLILKGLMPLSVEETFIINPWLPPIGGAHKPKPKDRPAFGISGY